MSDIDTRIIEFVTAVTNAMGLSLTATIEETADGPRVNLEGEGGDLLVRRRGEALTALQHITSSVFRDDMPEGQRLAVDCLGFQKDKDGELRTMAKFLAEKVVLNGGTQEMGPLNPYERRIVHLAVQEVPNATSESIGDAHMKTVIITSRR